MSTSLEDPAKWNQGHYCENDSLAGLGMKRPLFWPSRGTQQLPMLRIRAPRFFYAFVVAGLTYLRLFIRTGSPPAVHFWYLVSMRAARPLTTACGPASLILSSRQAVRIATSAKDLLNGQWPITYEEEPLAP